MNTTISTTLGAIVLAALAILTLQPVAYAGDIHSLSANVALTTDYRFRGISQNNEDIAVQGGLDYSYDPVGFYVGVWASSIEFNSAAADSASVEVDVYAGFRGDFGNGLAWDVGALYYAYPDQSEDDGPGVGDFNFWEIYGGLDYTFESVALRPTIGVDVAYSPDFFGEDGDGVYVAATLGLSLPADFTLEIQYGYQDVDGDKTTAPAGFDYSHWKVGIGKEWKGVGFDLSYHDTGSTGDVGCGDLCDGTLVFTVSASMDLF